MNIPRLTTNALLMLHGAIRNSLAVDDNTPEGREKIFDVRGDSDWRAQADQYEAELDRRNAAYDKIPW